MEEGLDKSPSTYYIWRILALPFAELALSGLRAVQIQVSGLDLFYFEGLGDGIPTHE